jgi:hypothetical protein
MDTLFSAGKDELYDKIRGAEEIFTGIQERPVRKWRALPPGNQDKELPAVFQWDSEGT